MHCSQFENFHCSISHPLKATHWHLPFANFHLININKSIRVTTTPTMSICTPTHKLVHTYIFTMYSRNKYTYICVYTHSPAAPFIKRGMHRWGLLLWRFGCHVGKLRRRIHSKSLNKRTDESLSLAPSFTLACSRIINPTLLATPMTVEQPHTIPHVLEALASRLSHICCASANS